MSIKNKRLCVGLNTMANISGNGYIRVVIHSAIKPPDKCINNVNLVNAVLNVIGIPFNIAFIPAFGNCFRGKCDGTVGHVANNSSDIGIGTFSATYDRLQSVQSSTILGYVNPISILSGKLSQKNSIRNDFHVFSTFDVSVWICILLSVVLVGVSDCYIHGLKRNILLLLDHIILAYQSVLSQNVERFGKLCCSKHSILVGLTLISFSILINCFKTVILSNLLSESLIRIDSIADLINFLKSTTSNISLVTDNTRLTYHLLKTGPDRNSQIVFKLLNKVKDIDYDQVYNGRIIAVDYSHIFHHVIKNNPHLNFHLSSEQYLGSALVMIYSKFIDKTIKYRIDRVCDSLFESGLQELWQLLKHSRRLKVNPTYEKEIITMESIRGLIVLLAVLYPTMILVLLFELINNNLNKKAIFVLLNNEYRVNRDVKSINLSALYNLFFLCP